MQKLITITIFVFALTISGLAQIKSVYTTTKNELCKNLSSKVDEGGSYEGECPGAGGYKVRLLEGDLRQTINIISPTKKKSELNFWSFYSGFSSIGEKIEWRVKGKVPVAMIARFIVADNEDSTKNISYLMISKIGKTESCVVDVILPGAKQNEDARISADAAASKPCKSNED